MTGISKQQLQEFEKLLASVNTDELLIAGYAKRYLQHILTHRSFYCHIYAHVLDHALVNCSKPKNEISLVDYGAGNGVLGLLAKYCGIGKVLLNDLNIDFLNAAKQLSEATGIALDGYIEGDVDELKKISGHTDILVATDVIEHVYNLDCFFATLKQINPAMITVMTTASNPANPFKVNALKKLQVKDELHGGTPSDNILFGEVAHESFLLIRSKIIKAYAGEKMTNKEVETLSLLTRGLQKDDIEKVVEKYLSQKILPVLISHPTNTCDPFTGSWSERLLSFEEYKAIYTNAGFTVAFYDGFYNEYDSSVKSRLLFFVNKLIPVASHRLSPFITLVGK